MQPNPSDLPSGCRAGQSAARHDRVVAPGGGTMRRIVPASVGVLVLAGLAFLFWPSPKYNRSKVDATLLSLQEPFRAVLTEYYMDGGSVGIRITDRDGQMREYALPVSETNPRRYDRVFVGAMHLKDKGKSPVEISDCADTRSMLIRLVSRYSPHDANTQAALIALRGLPRDYAAALLYGLLNREP